MHIAADNCFMMEMCFARSQFLFLILPLLIWKSGYAVYRCTTPSYGGKWQVFWTLIGLSMWNRYRTTSICLKLIIAQGSDASSSILVSLKCKAPSPAPTLRLVGTPATIVRTNHAARYAKHLATNLETLSVGSMSNYKTLLRLMSKIMFYPIFPVWSEFVWCGP